MSLFITVTRVCCGDGLEPGAWSLEDLLHTAAVVGDAPLGPGPYVQYGPVDHGWVEQRDLVADVLLQLIQGL